MKFTFVVNEKGMSVIKENMDFLYPNVSYDEDQSTVTLLLPEPDKSSIGQFMTAIKEKGLLIAKKKGNLIGLSSEYITKYPYDLVSF